MVYLWKLDKEIRGAEKVLSKIKPSMKLKFDIGVVRYLNGAELENFREKFLVLISGLRKKSIAIDYDVIRMQSIKYNCLLIGPKTINLGIIRKCNYKCIFCRDHGPFAKGENINSANDSMPFADISSVIEQAYKAGTENIIISGEGEPLMHPQILDIISYIGKHNLDLTILTNASVFKVAERIMELSDNLKLSFLVNMSAANPKKYNQLYGQEASNFYKVLRVIKNLNRKFPVYLNYIIMKNNLNDIWDFIRIVKSLGVESIRLKFPIFDYKRYKNILLSDKEVRELLGNINRILQFSRQCNVNVNYENIMQFFRRKIYQIRVHNCYTGWYYSSVAPDSNVYNCCIHNKAIGKIISGNFLNVYFSESSLNRCIEGKGRVSFNSENWYRCKICPRREV